jgi:hypothetical protein
MEATTPSLRSTTHPPHRAVWWPHNQRPTCAPQERERLGGWWLVVGCVCVDQICARGCCFDRALPALFPPDRAVDPEEAAVRAKFESKMAVLEEEAQESIRQVGVATATHRPAGLGYYFPPDGLVVTTHTSLLLLHWLLHNSWPPCTLHCL